jgi:hypothetical protein
VLVEEEDAHVDVAEAVVFLKLMLPQWRVVLKSVL